MRYNELLKEMLTSRRNLLILGRSGSGKSHLIRTFVEEYQGVALITAPTGTATHEIPGSVTNHTAFGLRPTVAFKWERARLNKSQIEAIRSCDTWLLDEASMIRKDVFEHINQTFQIVRGSLAPFGGARFIAVGDFWQLPPVTPEYEEEYVINATDGSREEDYYFLTSDAFRNREVFENLMMVELGGSFRQGLGELPFLQMLDRVRLGNLTQTDLLLLNSTFCFDNEDQVPILTSTRIARDLHNASAISNLEGKRYTSVPRIQWEEGETPIPNILIGQPGMLTLELVVGMRVIFNKNDNDGQRWVNGTCGTIQEICRSNSTTVSGLIVKIDNCTEPVLVHRVDFDVFLPGMNAKVERACTRKVVTIHQFPIEPGYSLTIHKAQGKSLDSAIIDMGLGSFAPGQLYVALSRLRSFSGLRLASMLSEKDAMASRFVKAFYERTKNARRLTYPS